MMKRMQSRQEVLDMPQVPTITTKYTIRGFRYNNIDTVMEDTQIHTVGAQGLGELNLIANHQNLLCIANGQTVLCFDVTTKDLKKIDNGIKLFRSLLLICQIFVKCLLLEQTKTYYEVGFNGNDRSSR